MWMKLAGMNLTAEDVIERGGIGSPSVRSPHFPLQKLAAVHPEGRCDWLSCQVGRSGPKSYPESTEGRPWGQPLKKPEGAPLNLG